MPLTLSFDPTHPFAAAARKKDTAMFLIVDKDTKEPVAYVTQQAAGTRDEAYMLADNIKDIVNGKAPLHRYGKDKRTMYWERNEETPPNELRFKFHMRGEDGESLGNAHSNPAATLTVIGSHLPLFERMLFDNPDALKIVAAQASEPERRANKRSHDSKPLNPGNRPVL